MKIVMFGHKTIPSRDGGVEIVVEELATRMHERGHDVIVLNRKRKNSNSQKSYKGVKLYNIFTINKKSLDALVYSFFATLKARFLKPDVIHVHAEGPCFFLWMLGKHKKTKLIVTIHGLDWQRSKWGGLATKIIKYGEKQAVKHADEIIVLSNSVKEYFKNAYNRETIFIPNGVNKPELLEPNEIKEKWSLEKDSYILFVARIVPEKGLNYLIKAFKRIESKTDKKLVIVGGPSHSQTYFDEVSKLCAGDDHIIMTGFQSGRVLDELFSNAYLYCLPSDVEGMPISLLEAMSFGNICLVSDIPENTSVVSADSFTFKKANINDLEEKLFFLINQDFATHVTQYIFKTWEEVVDTTLKIYEE